MKKDITDAFPIRQDEYLELDRRFGKLCYFIAHQLKKQNSLNNFTDDIEDINQDLQIELISAGSYHKRQVYIEKCLKAAKKHAHDRFLAALVNELESLWNDRTRHGANKQKYGSFQEDLLEKIVQKIVPKVERPNKDAPLKIDSKFATYCKTIVWNGQKRIGKKITQMKSIRANAVSLSEYDYLQ